MATTTQNERNGIDLDQFTGTVEAIRDNPDLATFRFRASNEWLGGGHSRTRIQGFWGAGQEDDSRERPFTLEGDEPPVLLGENHAANAVETVLHALGSCLAVGFAYNAAAEGIDVRSLEIDLEGELDLHGFLGLSSDVRPGYERINVRYTVDCDAPDARVEELCEHVQRTSPVMDLLRNPVPVNVKRKG